MGPNVRCPYGSQEKLVMLVHGPPTHNPAPSHPIVALIVSLVYFNIFIPEIFNFSEFSFPVVQFLASAFRAKSSAIINTWAPGTYYILGTFFLKFILLTPSTALKGRSYDKRFGF